MSRYDFSVPAGAMYSVTLKFAEIWYTQAGQRVFNVSINGAAVLTNFDIARDAGGPFLALDRRFDVSAPTGLIAIAFSGVTDSPKISAIEIAQAAGGGVSVTVSPKTATLTQSQQQQFTAAVAGTANTGVTWSISPQSGAITSTGLYTAPAAITQSQTVTVRATSVADNTKSDSAAVTLTPSSTGFNPVRVNSGGPAYTDPSGQIWSADTAFSGGSTRSTSEPIGGTTTPVLYQTARNGSSFQYQFSAPAGATYNVVLKFAEIQFRRAGQRLFNVSINGTAVLTNFDIAAQAGAANRALDRSFTAAPANGAITVQFTGVRREAMINAIEITQR